MRLHPPDTTTIRHQLAALMPELRERYAVRSISIFGSYARGQQSEESDLDLLVEFDRIPGILRFVGLAHLLEDRLGVRVDLFTRPMLKPRLLKRVYRDLVTV